jgi:TPR repeat protein
MKLRLFFLLTVFWLTLIAGQAYADSLPPSEITALAQRGNAAAEYELGRMYQSGRGVPQDYRRAVEWYRRSAEQGYAPAERSLGGMYRGGYGGLTEDDAEARKWYGKAAAQGDTLAKFALVIDGWRITAFVRSLPQGDRDAIFLLLIALLVAVPVGIFILFIVFCLRFIKGMRKRSS